MARRKRSRTSKSETNNQVIPATDGVSTRIARAETFREVVGRNISAFGPLWGRHRKWLARLPQATDDLSLELGLDVLNRMMNDPQISASLYTLVYQALSRGIVARPKYTDPQHPYFKQSMEMYDFISYNMEFCSDSLTSSGTSMMQVMEDLTVSRLVYGNSVSEWTGTICEQGPLAGKLGLASIKPKSPDVYSFVVDPYGNTVGIACFTGKGLQKDGPVHVYSQSHYGIWESDTENLPSGWEIIPVGKFLVSTHRPKFGDPRGQSCLRAAYNSWYLLMNLWPDYHKFLTQFASPSIKGTLGEKAMPIFDSSTGETTDPLDELFAMLTEFQNGTVLALRNGTEADIVFSNGDGTAFTKAIEMLNHQMIKSIQHSILGTETSQSQGRAASSVHKDVQDLPAIALKKGLTDALRNQVWKRLIQLNYGAEMAEIATPYASLGTIAPEDKSELIRSYAAFGGHILPSQLRNMANELELDPPTQEEIDVSFETLKTASKPKPVNSVNGGKPADAKLDDQEGDRSKSENNK